MKRSERASTPAAELAGGGRTFVQVFISSVTFEINVTLYQIITSCGGYDESEKEMFILS